MGWRLCPAWPDPRGAPGRSRAHRLQGSVRAQLLVGAACFRSLLHTRGPGFPEGETEAGSCRSFPASRAPLPSPPSLGRCALGGRSRGAGNARAPQGRGGRAGPPPQWPGLRGESWGRACGEAREPGWRRAARVPAWRGRAFCSVASRGRPRAAAGAGPGAGCPAGSRGPRAHPGYLLRGGSQLALDWALMTAPSRVQGPSGHLLAEPGGSGVLQASSRRPSQGLVVSWQAFQQLPLPSWRQGFPATRWHPAQSQAGASRKGGSCRTATQRLLPSLCPRALLSVSPQITDILCSLFL